MRKLTLRALLRALRALYPPVVPVHFNGRRFHLHTRTGRLLPALAGADGPPASDPPADPPEGAGGPPVPPQDPPADPPDPDAWDPERAKRTIEAQRASEKQLRSDLRALQEQVAAAEREKLSEQDRLKAERDDALARVEQARHVAREGRLLALLAKPEHQLVDATAAAKLITGVEYDDDHAPTNFDERLAATVEQYPFLKGEAKPPTPEKPDINGPDGRKPGPRPNLTADELEAAQAAGMTPERYEAMKGVSTLAEFQAAQQRLTPAP